MLMISILLHFVILDIHHSLYSTSVYSVETENSTCKQYCWLYSYEFGNTEQAPVAAQKIIGPSFFMTCLVKVNPLMLNLN